MLRRFGLGRGSRVSFAVVGDHIEVRPCKPPRQTPISGTGLLHSSQPLLPADFDLATLLHP